MGTDLLAGFNFQATQPGGYGYVQPPQNPGCRNIFVRSIGPQDGDPSFLKSATMLTTLSAGLSACRAGMGDVVHLLAGHSESVTDATMMTNLKAGTIIWGYGQGSNAPQFNWTATGAQWQITAANVIIHGLQMNLDGANGVVKAILVTAANVCFDMNEIRMASSPTLKAVIGIEAGAGADRFCLQGNYVRGSADVVTDPIKIVAAVDGLKIVGNRMQCAGTSASGIVHVTAAATGMFVVGNIFDNLAAASIAGFGIDAVAATGVIADMRVATLSTGAQTTSVNGLAMGAGCLVRCFEVRAANDPRLNGMILPTADT